MSIKYKPTWYYSPFGHVKYALVRSQKQLDKLIGKNTLTFLSMTTTAQCTIFDDVKRVCVVEAGDLSSFTVAEAHATIVHEAIHVHQQIMERMHEDKPSVEFEAYSVQQIVVDLLTAYIQSENK
jgi:hypothetical protein